MQEGQKRELTQEEKIIFKILMNSANRNNYKVEMLLNVFRKLFDIKEEDALKGAEIVTKNDLILKFEITDPLLKHVEDINDNINIDEYNYCFRSRVIDKWVKLNNWGNNAVRNDED